MTDYYTDVVCPACEELLETSPRPGDRPRNVRRPGQVGRIHKSQNLRWLTIGYILWKKHGIREGGVKQ